jgi:hypothetical protein
MAFIKVHDGYVIGTSMSPADGYIHVPVDGEIVDALLADKSKLIRYVNGDLTVEVNKRYWALRYTDLVQELTRPKILVFDYGEKIHLPVSDLPIITMYASSDLTVYSYCDADGVLHALTTHEWRHVCTVASEILSNLSQIRYGAATLTADSEERYQTLEQQFKRRVEAAYARAT